jgi:outer membrane protein assembly factor BamB
MDFEKEIVNLNNGLIYKDWYIYSGDLAFPPTLMAFNLKTGEKDWEYIHTGVIDEEIDYGKVVNNIYMGRCNKGILGIDLDTRQGIWEIDFTSKNFSPDGRGIVHDGFVYQNIVWALGTVQQTLHLMKIDPHSGDYEFVLSYCSGNFRGISPPAFWKDPQSGQDLMILNEYPDPGKPPEQSSQNIRAIDLATKETVWEKVGFTEFFASYGGHPPIIYNDIVITGGDWSIYAFDVRTGEQLWRYQLPGYSHGGGFWTSTNHLLVGDKLYLNPLSEEVLCLNPETGQLIWNNPKGGANCTDNMVYYEKEDLLVFTSWGYGSVMVLDALTGKTLHKEHRYDDSSYNNDVVYDPETDMFFTSTYKHAVGFRVQRP